MKKIYLDYAAATPVRKSVLEIMMPFFVEQFYNPSAVYLLAKSVRKEFDQARAKIAKCFGALPAEIIFTSGATEANNLAVSGVIEASPGAEVIVSSIEHDSVLAPAKKYGARTVEVDEFGQLNIEDLKSKITDKTALISVMYVNNEIGSIQRLSEIAKIVESVRKKRIVDGNIMPIYLHTDATQAPLFFDLNVARLKVDLATINGSKIYGPKQSGALYIKRGTKISPIILGGGQEYGMRSGTENVAGSIGLAEALVLAQADREKNLEKIAKLREIFIQEVNNIDGLHFLGRSKLSAPHIVNILFYGEDGERMMMELDEVGIMVAVGSACSASSDEPSHVLSAIGLNDQDARSCLRFSFGVDTTESDVKIAVSELKKILKKN